MKIKFVAILGSLLFILGGCTESNQKSMESDKDKYAEEKTERKTSEMTDNMRFNEESNRPLENEPNQKQSEVEYQKENKQRGNNPKVLYTNKETTKIANKLLKRSDIILAQVTETDETIYIAVKLNNKHSPTIKDDIYNIVQQFDPDKEIVIMTNVKQWDHQKDTNARALPKGIGKMFEDFFNQ